MASGQRRRPGSQSPAAFLVVAAVGGLLLSFVKLETEHWLLPVVISAILIVAYGFFLWDWELKGPKFEHAGDNLYYVGFLYTLMSLAVTLYRYNRDDETSLVQGFGVALSSTVFGLIGRVVVNQSSGDEAAQVEAAERQRLVVAHRELRAQMDHSIQDYQRFREDLGELRESIERAKEVTAEERQALANEVTAIEDLRDLGSRLDKAAEEAVARIAERQEETAAHMKDAAMEMLRSIASQQEVLNDGMAKAQREALDRVAASLDGAVSSLNGSTASMARTIGDVQRQIEADASSLRSAMDRSLESFRAADFEREVGKRVLDPAAEQLRLLLDGFRPLVESLRSTHASQEAAVAESRQILQQLSRASSQNEDLAGRYQDAAESLAKASGTLESLPKQLDRQSTQSKAVAQEVAVTGERLGELTGALNSASDSLVAAVARLAPKRRRGIFGALRRGFTGRGFRARG